LGNNEELRADGGFQQCELRGKIAAKQNLCPTFILYGEQLSLEKSLRERKSLFMRAANVLKLVLQLVARNKSKRPAYERRGFSRFAAPQTEQTERILCRRIRPNCLSYPSVPGERKSRHKNVHRNGNKGASAEW